MSTPMSPPLIATQHPNIPELANSTQSLTVLTLEHFKTYTKCPLQFGYKFITHRAWPSDQTRYTLGRSIHKLFEFQARGLRVDACLPGCTSEAQAMWAKLQAIPYANPATCKILANEWAFWVPLTGAESGTVWITGRLDRVIAVPPELRATVPALAHTQVAIVDWKTGMGVPKNPASAWQTRLYLWALVEARARLGLAALPPEAFAFVYVGLRNASEPIEFVPIPYTAQAHAATTHEVQNLIATVSPYLQGQGKPAALPTPTRCPDRYCAYKTICPVG